jgi:hypothetical protein
LNIFPALDGEQVTTFDNLSQSVDTMTGLADTILAALGSAATVVTPVAGTQTSPASLSINIGPFQIYELADTLAAPIGTFDAIDTEILQQGTNPGQQVNLNTDGLEAGQSVWWLISASYLQVPQVRPGDPTNGLRNFFNSANNAMPLSGPSGSGDDVATVVSGTAIITTTMGTPATTDSNEPPAVPAGNVPLFLINLAFGQTTITNGEIMVAGPEAYTGAGWEDGYPASPILTGLLQSHHGGVPGQAPQIHLETEVQGTLPYTNMLVSDQTPAPATGDIAVQGVIPIFEFGTVDPNGNVAGKEQTIYANVTNNSVWWCKTTGTSSTAVWEAMSSVIPMKWTPGTVTGTNNINGTSGTFYIADATAAVVNATLPPNPADGTVYKFARSGVNDVNILVNGTAGAGTNQIIFPTGTIDTNLALHEYGGVVDLIAMPGGWYVG